MRKTMLLLLPLLLLVVGCGSYATVATNTVEAIGAAELVAARTGAEAHKEVLRKLADEALAKRRALGCGDVATRAPDGIETFPLGCKVAEWVEYRDAVKARGAEAERRWEGFVLAMRTVDAAVTTTALATKVYTETQGDFNLAGVVGDLLRAWAVAAAILREWGVEPPAIGGGR